MPKTLNEMQAAQRRRFTVEFEQGSYWFEYAPGLYSDKLIDRYRTRATTSTEGANRFLLTTLLTGWELHEALTSDAIARLNIATSVVIVNALLADLATYFEDLKTRIPTLPQPFEPPPTA